MGGKLVRDNLSRLTVQKKIAEAMAKKPTAASVNAASNALTKGILPHNQQQFIQERLIRNSVSRKRFQNNRPQVIYTEEPYTGTIADPPPCHCGFATEIVTPQWFRTTKKVEVSVIVPMYKSKNVIVDLIKSWPFEETYGVEIIFVDDKCPDNSKDVVIKAWNSLKEKGLIKQPIGKIICNRSNSGYGMSCNAGAAAASGDFLIFLNADTELTKNWIAPMIKLFSDPKVGLVGNLHLKRGGNWDETIDSAGSEWVWGDNSFVHIGRHSYNKKGIARPMPPQEAPADVLATAEREMVTGCCFAIRASLFNYIGGFNPNYRIGYWEDSELCMNVRELGHKIMFTSESKIYHKLGHTHSGGHKFYGYNRDYFKNKWIKSGRMHELLIPPEERSEVGSILVKRTAAHGDVLIAASVCAGLKKKYPEAKIMFSSFCPEITANNPYIDEFVPIKKINEVHKDVIYNLDLAYEWRPKINVMNVYSEFCGLKKEDCILYLAKQEYTERELPKDFVIIHPGMTDWIGRNWPHENFVKVAKNLMDRGENIVCIGKHSESDIPCTLDLRGKTNPTQLAWVMSKAKLFIGIDSFPMHVAQVADIPGVAFFGSVSPEVFIYNNKMIPLTAKNLSCLGCHHRQLPPLMATKKCETGTLDCIKQVSAENMLAIVKKILYKDKNDIVSLVG